MAVDWVLNFPCEPKETLGEGNFIDGSEVILDCLKARNRADAVAQMAQQHGEAPEGKSIVLRIARPDGEMEDQEVHYEDLVAQAERLEAHAPACKGCPANVMGQPFGCMGAVNYPISAAVEQWLAGRLQPSTAIGGKLFLAAIRDFGYTGAPIEQFREGGLFELTQPIKKKLKSGLFSSESVTTNQLFQAIFCIGEPLNSGHCLGVLLWLGCLHLDGAAIETPERASTINQLRDPVERAQRTTLVTGADSAADGVQSFEILLQAMYHSWVLDEPLWVSA